VFKGKIERGHGVFRRVEACATMSEK
jgi:hypothetical protein